jgi:hypothetical protein
MEFVLFVLGVAGFLAALRRLMFAGFRLLKGSVEAFVTREIASARAQQGDITGLVEADTRRKSARNARLLALLAVAAWSAALIVPLFTAVAGKAYAIYSLLWLLPQRRRAAP